MHYDTARNDHGLRFNPFKALVAPRPIGWVSTVSASGVPNLAPYSFFNTVGTMNRPTVATDGKTASVPAEWDGAYR